MWTWLLSKRFIDIGIAFLCFSLYENLCLSQNTPKSEKNSRTNIVNMNIYRERWGGGGDENENENENEREGNERAFWHQAMSSSGIFSIWPLGITFYEVQDFAFKEMHLQNIGHFAHGPFYIYDWARSQPTGEDCTYLASSATSEELARL